MSQQPRFPKMDLDDVRQQLERLFEQVVRRNQRVEITDGGESCVIISKAELESLERALNILGDARHVRDLKESLATLTAADAR